VTLLRITHLPAQHRRWVLCNAIAVPAVVNTASNAALAWMSTRGETWVPLWGVPLVGGASTITDTVGTFFLLPLMTCVMCTTAVHRYRRRGKLSRLAPADGLAGRLPEGRARRGLVLGALCTAMLAPLAVPLLAGLDPAGLSRPDFVLYKALLGLALGMAVTPLVAMRAMTDPAAPDRPLALASAPARTDTPVALLPEP
jgi:hypothetical protein